VTLGIAGAGVCAEQGRVAARGGDPAGVAPRRGGAHHGGGHMPCAVDHRRHGIAGQEEDGHCDRSGR
jgi:hypothetical protein